MEKLSAVGTHLMKLKLNPHISIIKPHNSFCWCLNSFKYSLCFQSFSYSCTFSFYSETSKKRKLSKGMLACYGAFCGFVGTLGLTLRYSSTKTCRILLRFWMAERSRFCSLSSNVCHTEGKGEGIRWRTRTPNGEAQDQHHPTEQHSILYVSIFLVVVVVALLGAYTSA